MSPTLAPRAVCAVCGEWLGESDLCLACLLRAGLDDEEQLPATRFGDFEIERADTGSLAELGRGAMGVTYRAHDTVLNRAVALKVIQTANSQPVRERFLREARTAAGLRHPNIAAVFQFGASSDGERCYCAMELVEGETLDALVKRQGPLSPDLVLETGIQVTRALIAAAERGLVHRDLKPGNIMLRGGDDPTLAEVKVIDFGLAKAVSAAGEMELTHGGFVGTPAFASPEQFARGAIDARTDIYALGVTMWFALTGRLPFAGTTIDEIRSRQAKETPPLDHLQARDVPRPLIEILRSCLAHDPAERPASARELMASLETCRALLAKNTTKRKATVLAVAAVTLVGLAAVVLLPQREAPQTTTLPAGPFEHSTSEKPVTENSEAYLLYVRARTAELQRGAYKEAIEDYRRAIALDPLFAVARARLSICLNATDPGRQDLLPEARTEAEEALRLQPNLGEARLALAHWYSLQARDDDRALAELRRAAELMPNSAEVHLGAAFIYKRQGRIRERLEALRRAAALDPNHRHVSSFLILTLRWVRDWRGAIDAQDRRVVITSNPDHASLDWFRAQDEFRLSGNIDVLKQALARAEITDERSGSAEQLNFFRFEVAMLERDYARAAESLQRIPAEAFNKLYGVFFTISQHSKSFYEALLSVMRSDAAEAREEALRRAAETTVAEMEPLLATRRTRHLAQLAILHSFRGRKEEAIQVAREAIEFHDPRSSWIEHNDMQAALALVYTQTGESEKAIELIERLLTVPSELQDGGVYNMTHTDLKWRSVWDPLRSHPRFQKLLAGPEPKTVY